MLRPVSGMVVSCLVQDGTSGDGGGSDAAGKAIAKTLAEKNKVVDSALWCGVDQGRACLPQKAAHEKKLLANKAFDTCCKKVSCC